MRFEICKKCGTQKGKKYSEDGSSKMICRKCDDEAVKYTMQEGEECPKCGEIQEEDTKSCMRCKYIRFTNSLEK